MAEYIEREKVIDALHQLVAETADDSVHTKAYLAGYKAALEMAELYMIDISAVDVCPEKYRIEREIPIWELELSMRSYNCLTRAGCKTVGFINPAEMCGCDYCDLQRIIGDKEECLHEITVLRRTL